MCIYYNRYQYTDYCNCFFKNGKLGEVIQSLETFYEVATLRC